MENLSYIILPVVLSLLAYRTSQDLREYDRFKKLKSTKERQASYQKWLLQSLGLFGIGSILALLLIGHISNIHQPLPSLSGLLPHHTNTPLKITSDQVSFILGICISALCSAFVFGAIARRRNHDKPIVIGDITAMLPRNNSERLWGLLLALNAGFSEELFFRLTLPILFYIVFSNPQIAILCSAAVFGLVHYYQGKVGVFFTFLMGIGFTYIYLLTGLIWVPMILHALVDMNGLLLQPALQSSVRKKRKSS